MLALLQRTNLGLGRACRSNAEVITAQRTKAGDAIQSYGNASTDELEKLFNFIPEFSSNALSSALVKAIHDGIGLFVRHPIRIFVLFPFRHQASRQKVLG